MLISDFFSLPYIAEWALSRFNGYMHISAQFENLNDSIRTAMDPMPYLLAS